MKLLLINQWKEFTRTGGFQRELGFKIFLLIVSFFMIFSIGMLASYLAYNISSLGEAARQEPIRFFCRVLVYYFFGELLMRYMIQSIPVLSVHSYLTLPIKKNTIVQYLLIRSVFHPLNLLIFVISIPVLSIQVLPNYGLLNTGVWGISLICISFSLHFFHMLFKKQLEEKAWVWIVILVLFGLSYFLNNYSTIDLIGYASVPLNSLLSYPTAVLIPLAILILMVMANYSMFKKNLYDEEISAEANTKEGKLMASFDFLSRAGIKQQLILEEIKMILRHKRSRSTLLLSLFFIVYSFFMASSISAGDSPFMNIFIGIFVSAIFALNYGQFAWAWHTNQMDLLFSLPISIHEWVESKFLLISASIIINVILALPLLYFGWELYLIIIACSFYNLGINTPLLLRFALWDPKPIDLNKSAFMNYQGVGAAQWILGFPVILLPVGIYYLFGQLINPTAGIIAISLIGLVGLVSRKHLLSAITSKLKKKKYELIHSLSV